MKKRDTRSKTWLTIASVTILGCGSASTSTPPATEDGEENTISCELQTRDTYSANMEKVGKGSAFRFTLVESVPAPPSRGRNVWTLVIRDASGAGVAGADIQILATMPAHGHSSPAIPTVAAEADRYTVSGISLFMPGLWEITVTAVAGDRRDSATFTFCVAG